MKIKAAYPLHARYVRPTTAGPVACDARDRKALRTFQRHPFAHLFNGAKAAECGFDDYDGLEELDVSKTEGPIDWERLICGDCYFLAVQSDLDENEDQDPWENLVPIEGAEYP